MTVAVRLLAISAIAYGLVVVILFALQSRFVYPAPQTPAPLVAGYTQVTLNTDDGLSLRAFHREAAEDMPTVLYFHGNGGTLGGATISNTAIVEAGIGALLVEYRGYGGNPGKPSEQGFYLDADAALQWLKRQGIAPSHTVVIGNSIGGGVATYATQKLEDMGSPPAGLVLIAPFTSLPDVAARTLWWLPVRSLMSDSYPNHERLKTLGQVPVLIQHGTADEVIEDSHGRALAQIPPMAEFQSFAGSGHSLSFEQRSQDARLEWILDLLNVSP